MIRLEEINAMIEDQKEKIKPDTDKELHLTQLINDNIAAFSIAVDDGNVEEAERLHGVKKQLKQELSEVQDLNLSKESGAYQAALLSQGKLGKLCKQFETQQLELADSLLPKEEAAAQKVLEARDALLKAIADMRAVRKEIIDVVHPSDLLRPYTPNPIYAPNGEIYQAYKAKMTQFNFAAMGNQILRASGYPGVTY